MKNEQLKKDLQKRIRVLRAPYTVKDDTDRAINMTMLAEAGKLEKILEDNK